MAPAPVEEASSGEGQRLLSTTPTTPRALRDAGYAIESVQRAIGFRWSETAADFDAVLRLRHDAYGAAGKVDADAPYTVMADSFDTKAACLMGEHQGRLVGTARLVTPATNDPTEYDQFVTLPEWIDRDEIAVLSRIATHIDYRGGDLVYALVLRSLAAAKEAGRSIVLGGCTQSLFHLYERVGARHTARFFNHGALGGVREELIYFESACVVTGAGVRNDLWREICVDGAALDAR